MTSNSNTIPTELQMRLKEINSWLFYGDKGKVAKRSRKTLTYVGMVLKGKARSLEVIECAQEVMNENKARIEVA